MITDKEKSTALALLKSGDSPENVSEVLQLPYMLVRDWADAMDVKDLTKLQANALALNKVIKGELLPNTAANKEMLRLKIEETAIDIVEAVKTNINSGDIIQSRSLQLLANTCSQLYKTILGENIGNPSEPNDSLSMLEQIGID